jgi:uncharacterized protein YidB (DUF937 family)
MSLLDSVMDVLGTQSTGGGNVEQLVSLLGNGGLESIVAKLQTGGLGDVIQSWIGTGANLPVNSDQLHSVLGSETVANLASSLGVSGSNLANVLPSLIDQLTPNGSLPENGISDLVTNAMSSGAVKDILGGLFK